MKNKRSKKLLADYANNIFFAAPYRNIILKRGKGMWVWDVDGNKYLDMMSGQFCLPFGHSDTITARMVCKQTETMINTNALFLTEDVLQGARALSSIAHKLLQKVFFLSTGAEAVEFALRNAKAFSGKEAIASLTVGYHGLTLATQALSNGGTYAKPMVSKIYHLPSPDITLRKKNETVREFIAQCLKQTDHVLGAAQHDLAAIIVEPVISVGGMIYPPKQYFQGLVKIAKKHSALLIFDESQTGIGRTGTWFGYEHCGVVPDMVVLAKGIGLGFPVSAVLMKTTVATRLEGKVMHFSSHQNDPLSGAMAACVISTIKKRKLLPIIETQGAYLLARLRQISVKHPLIQNPRGRGLMLGFDLDEKIFTAEQNPGQRLITLLEMHGMLIQAVRRGKVFRILPAFIITKKEIDFFITTLDVCMTQIEREIKSSI